ncbi:MAG TPA: methyltransferase [Blastocatellia bacterium]|nr:methyltransferase [Blastocatellia bacterium]
MQSQKSVEETGENKEKQTQPSPTQQMLGMITNFWTSQLVIAGDSLGIFKALANGPATASELAHKQSFNEDAGNRFLTACVAIGVLKRDGDKYANSELADQTLVPGRDGYMGGFIAHSRNDLYQLWAHLDDAVRENSPRWSQVFGATSANPFEQMYKDPEGLRNFMYAMRNGSLQAVEGLLAVYDFSQHKCLMDVGGALGTVSVAVAQRNPHLKAISFDLPPVGPLATEYIQSQGISDRVRSAAGDMFKNDLPRDADVIHLSWILHDWSDDKCVAILRNCYSALPSGGTILIGEMLLNDDGSGPLFPALMSLNMLVATDGGRERTAGEYQKLLEGAGFIDVHAQKLESLRDLIIAKKK